jgi:hypothetical protein
MSLPNKRAESASGKRGRVEAIVESASEGATDKVYRVISEGIRAGMFVPGQHLLEPELTRRIGISRGSLREALKHLAAAGLITLNRYRGAYISALDRKSVLDLLDTLEPLARLAARLAAQNCNSCGPRPTASRPPEERVTTCATSSSAADSTTLWWPSAEIRNSPA